jgi:MFS family permease
MPSFESMRHREFRLYWVSTALVFFEQGMTNIALIWLVLELTDSVAWVSAVFAARGIPIFLLTVSSGVIADRWDRRKILTSLSHLRCWLRSCSRRWSGVAR